MEYTNLGSTGLKVSRLFFGGLHIGGPAVDRKKAEQLIHAAWDVGINTFYTSDTYSNGAAEGIIGSILKPRRDDMVLMVKTGGRIGTAEVPVSSDEKLATLGLGGRIDYDDLWRRGVPPTARGLSRKHIMQAVEASLRKLQTDYIDIYVAHFWDPFTPVEETLAAMDALIRQGKVRYIGCSQTKAWQLYRALWVSEMKGLARYESVQAWLSVLQRDAKQELLPAAKSAGVSFLAFASLAGGRLAEYDRNSVIPRGQPNVQLIEKLRELSKIFGRNLGELAQAWVLAQDGVTALQIGPTEADEFLPQARAVTHPLSKEEVEAIEKVLNDES